MVDLSDLIRYVKLHNAPEAGVFWLQQLPADLNIHQIPRQSGFDFLWADWLVSQLFRRTDLEKRYFDALWIITESSLEETGQPIDLRISYTHPRMLKLYYKRRLELVEKLFQWIKDA